MLVLTRYSSLPRFLSRLLFSLCFPTNIHFGAKSWAVAKQENLLLKTNMDSSCFRSLSKFTACAIVVLLSLSCFSFTTTGASISSLSRAVILKFGNFLLLLDFDEMGFWQFCKDDFTGVSQSLDGYSNFVNWSKNGRMQMNKSSSSGLFVFPCNSLLSF